MFAPVDSSIKEKVIAAYLTGQGRNQIARELHAQGIQVSHGSISNIINAYKRKNEQPIDIGSPSSGDGLAVTPNNFVTPIIQKREYLDIDFADNPYPESDIVSDPDADYDERYDGLIGEQRLQYTPRLEISDTHYDNRVITIKETEKDSGESDQDQPKSSASNSEDSSLGIDWDSNHQARFVKWVMSEKRRRQESERQLREQWGFLVQERNYLEEQKRNLEAREARLSEVKDLIPSAAELKSMGVGFNHINSWINVIREYALRKMVDERTATWRLAEDLKACSELAGFEDAIQNAKNQLALLNMVIEGQKEAIAIIVDLKKSGMTDEDISNLVKVVSKWSSKVGQGNGSSFELDSRLNLQNTPQ